MRTGGLLKELFGHSEWGTTWVVGMRIIIGPGDKVKGSPQVLKMGPD